MCGNRENVCARSRCCPRSRSRCSNPLERMPVAANNISYFRLGVLFRFSPPLTDHHRSCETAPALWAFVCVIDFCGVVWRPEQQRWVFFARRNTEVRYSPVAVSGSLSQSFSCWPGCCRISADTPRVIVPRGNPALFGLYLLFFRVASTDSLSH